MEILNSERKPDQRMFMSITSSKQDALQKSQHSNARVFITVYEGSVHLAEKLLQSAKAAGNDISKFIVVGTDGTEIEGFRNLPLDLPQGNPISPNRAFAYVAKLCYDLQDDFIFLDSDCTFLKPNAVERITTELIGREGTVLGQPIWTHNEKYHGWSWNGNAAYRWFTWDKFNLGSEPIPDQEPYDLWLSTKFFHGHCAPTGLYHNTMHKENITDLSWIPNAAVIHHTCIDGSVADLVVNKFKTKTIA